MTKARLGWSQTAAGRLLMRESCGCCNLSTFDPLLMFTAGARQERAGVWYAPAVAVRPISTCLLLLLRFLITAAAHAKKVLALGMRVPMAVHRSIDSSLPLHPLCSPQAHAKKVLAVAVHNHYKRVEHEMEAQSRAAAAAQVRWGITCGHGFAILLL